MAESYQPPAFPHPVPQQPPQPGITSWYPLPPHPYQPQQHQQQQQQQQPPPPPPQQHHNMQWPMPPPGDQSFNYPQPLPYHSQGDYYPQQPPHQYPPPLQPSPPQFTYIYGSQDQVWQPSNNWGYQQWASQGQNASLTQEEVWAAKARAWAASKAAQNETDPSQSGPMAHQGYQDYFQHQEPPSLNALEGPPGAYRVESISQEGPLQPSVASRFTQQQPPLPPPPQSQTSPHVSQPQLNYTEQPSTSGYELHQQKQQIPQNYQQQQQQQQPPPPPQQPQPPAQNQQQAQYQPPSGMEGLEAEFGLSPASMQNWAPAGGPGMPFPPAMDAGTAQVPMFGRMHAPQGVGFPSGTPFVAAGPAIGPGPGTPTRPMFIPDGFGERPKKAAVPSWLREELMKKKAAGLAGNSTGMLLSDDSNRVNGGEPAIHLNPRLGISDKLRTSSPGLSDDEQDDEEAEVEAARNAAINQEIKRLLTEVLLKVTEDVFEEIAQEVLEEDDDETFQGKIPLDEQDNSLNPTSPPSQAPTPSMPARVLVSSLKNHGANDDGDKDGGVSGGAAGDVLGLGEYGSDEDDVSTKDHHMSVKVLEMKELRRKDFQEHVSIIMNKDLDSSGQKGEFGEIAGVSREIDDEGLSSDQPSDKESYRGKDINIEAYSGKGVYDKDVDKEKRRYQEDEKLQSKDRHTQSLEPAQASLKEYQTDAQNGPAHLLEEPDAPVSKSNLSIAKEEHWRGLASSVREKDNNLIETAAAHVGRKMSKEKATQGFNSDKQHQDKHESKSDSKERSIMAKDLPSAANKISNSSLHKVSMKESDSKERASLSSHKSANASGLEKRREERMIDNSRKKGMETVRSERSLETRDKDSGRDRRKEKVKEKEKPRERDYERERRKTDKGKREREGRSKRRDGSEKKARHRSSSSSSRHADSRSSSSSSHDSRGRSHAWRSNRRHNSISSPGRLKKRRSASKSPVHRRRRS